MAPLAPYIAVAEASFNTSILSISLGLIKFRDDCDGDVFPVPLASTEGSIGNPSTAYKGSVPPSIELVPLIWILKPSPGAFPPVTFTPAMRPFKASSGLFMNWSSNCFDLIPCDAPLRSLFFIVP